MKILVIKNDGLGDLVLASGILEQLATVFDAKVDLVTCEDNREFAETIRGLRRIWFVSRDQLGGRFKSGSAPAMTPLDGQTLRGLRESHYDLAIVLRRFIRASTLELMEAVSADLKICCWQFPTNIGKKIADEVTEANGWKHARMGDFPLWEPAFYAKFIESELGISVNPSPTLGRVEAKAPDVRPPNPVGLIISGSSSRWPDAKWLELSRLLLEAGHSLLLIRSRRESKLAERISSLNGRKVRDGGEQNLREVAASLSSVGIVIGNDTGLMHFSQKLGIPAIVISGGGHFRRFFPWEDSSLRQILVAHPMNCFDCAWACWQPVKRCMTEVPAEAVVAAISDIGRGGPPRYAFTKAEVQPYTVARIFAQSPNKTANWLR